MWRLKEIKRTHDFVLRIEILINGTKYNNSAFHQFNIPAKQSLHVVYDDLMLCPGQ